VFDYGAGNLHSLLKALEGPSHEVRVERDARDAVRADVLVLPGVGAFGPAAAALEPARRDVADALRDGLPCLGICLGLQLLCDESAEGPGAGLGVFPGRVARLEARRVPQIGWNTLEDVRDPLLLTSGLSNAYFANGFVARPEREADVTAWATHDGDRFPAAMRRLRTVGVQFHPEKSSSAGVRFIQAFVAESAS
jgi:glutamine amidotransferase